MFSNLFVTGGLWGLFLDILRSLTFMLDRAVYRLVEVAYQVFYYLANATLLNDTIVTNVTTRVYTILGILMVFVLAFNLLNYIVDPDKITDSKIGATAFVKDVLIALAVITLSPILFTKLYSLQSQILSSGVIANLILGGNSAESAATPQEYVNHMSEYRSLTDYYIQHGAHTMTASVYVAFLYPEDDFTALDCYTDKMDAQYQDYCDAYTAVKMGEGLVAFEDFITDDDYNFTPFLTTIAGVVLLFFMFSFCLNLAKRVGKMAILQLIAPIPVTLELLPNKKGLRKNWSEMLIRVYCESFMYLLTMYIIVFLISLVPVAISQLWGELTSEGFSLVKITTVVFLIFGLLQFGKEAPQMIFDLLGIKQTGTIAEAAKRALAMGGVTAGLAGATVGRFSRNVVASRESGRGWAHSIGSGFAGAASGAGRTLWGARNVHNISDARNLRRNVNQQVTGARVNRSAYWHGHGGNIQGWAGGHFNDIRRGIDSGVRSYFGADPLPVAGHADGINQNRFYERQRQEEVNSGAKKIYDEKIKGLFKKDGVWTQIKAMEEQAKANGGDYIDASGNRTSAAELKRRRVARESAILSDKANALQVYEGVKSVQNYVDAHQGIDGMSSTNHVVDIQRMLKSDGTIDMSLYNNVMDDLEKNGFTKQLDDIRDDGAYQRQKADNRLREDARQASQQAAQQANNQNQGNNNGGGHK